MGPSAPERPEQLCVRFHQVVYTGGGENNCALGGRGGSVTPPHATNATLAASNVEAASTRNGFINTLVGCSRKLESASRYQDWQLILRHSTGYPHPAAASPSD